MSNRVAPFALRLIALLSVLGPVNAANLDDDATLNPLSELDPLSLKAFFDRPLFSPSRRPLQRPADVQQEEDVRAETLNIQLLGIVITPDGAVAQVKEKGQPLTRSLRKGDVFQDWQVLTVDSASVLLGRDGETRLLSVFTSSAKTSNATSTENAAPSGKSSSQQDLTDFFGSSAEKMK